MSRLFGPMRQVGIVVRDIEKAMRHWVEVCGVGPWFYTEQLPMDEFFSSATMCRAFTATSSPPATRGCSIGQAGR